MKRSNALFLGGLTFLVAAAGATAQSTSPAVFVLNNVSDTIASFTVNPDGTVSMVDLTPTSDGPQSAAISHDGRFLAVGHGTQSTTFEVLKIFRVHPDASLEEVFDGFVNDSPLGMTWVSDDVVAIAETGGSTVRTFQFIEETGQFIQLDIEPTGSFNTSVASTPDGSYLFAQDSSSNTIRSFQVNPDGTLDLVQTLGTGSTFPLRLWVTNDGSKLYSVGGISNGGDKVLGFSIDGDGMLSPLPGSPFTSPGVSPAYVASTGDDDFLAVGHGTDATVHIFDIQPDGSITPTGFMFDVGFQGTIGTINTIGRLLFITDESTVFDGITGLYSFTVEDDGSLTQNGPIADTMGTRPQTIVTWGGALIGDLNGDGSVNGADLAVLLANWGPCPSKPDPCPANLNGDGIVDGADLAILLANWTG